MPKFKENFLFRYLSESKQELSKVTWPNKKDTYRYTLIVIGISLSVGLFFFVLDWIFNQGLNVLISL